jgi:hypothetical protein
MSHLVLYHVEACVGLSSVIELQIYRNYPLMTSAENRIDCAEIFRDFLYYLKLSSLCLDFYRALLKSLKSYERNCAFIF